MPINAADDVDQASAKQALAAHFAPHGADSLDLLQAIVIYLGRAPRYFGHCARCECCCYWHDIRREAYSALEARYGVLRWAPSLIARIYHEDI